MPPGSMPDTRSVRASNVLRIAVHRPQGSDLVMLLVVEDNLVKGAAGPGGPEHEPDVRPARDHGPRRRSPVLP